MSYYARRKTESKREDYFQNLLTEGIKPVERPTGVSRSVVKKVLKVIDKDTDLIIDVVMALLDSNFPSLFSKHDGPFSDGASTADLGCYVGIFMRRGKKLDREGRDYWIKPLREVGIIEVVTFDSENKTFVDGHIKAKSPNSSYRLNKEFINLLKSYSDKKCKIFFNSNEVTQRLQLQSSALHFSYTFAGRGKHYGLIQASIDFYAKNFLPNFKVIYIDDSDGDRINDKEREILESNGIEIDINDAFPDVILISMDGRALWFIEAVTSDGEVDLLKVDSLTRFAKRNNKSIAGFTTTYWSWRAASSRQGANKNLAPGSYMWIVEDASRVFHVSVKDYQDNKNENR